MDYEGQSVLMTFASFYAGKRVLVTGDTGFKGSWLVEWLLRLGSEVTGIGLDPHTDRSLFESLELESRISHHRVDIRDLKDVENLVRSDRPDVLFHLAAQSLVRRSYCVPIDTLATNVMGTAHLLAGVAAAQEDRSFPCSVVVVTSDKCYSNEGVDSTPFRESDPMGGSDIYSASKAAAELVVDAWRRSFASAPEALVRIATCRAGNVIGGGDWAEDRIVPDSIRALERGTPIKVRMPDSIRPWQHVLDALSGYLLVGAALQEDERMASAWNFGPGPSSERSVAELCDLVIAEWGRGTWRTRADLEALPEAQVLRLDAAKAHELLGWRTVWPFARTVGATVEWYKHASFGTSLAALTRRQIDRYVGDARGATVAWATT